MEFDLENLRIKVNRKEYDLNEIGLRVLLVILLLTFIYVTVNGM